MVSTNFEILRKGWPELASFGGFAEQYARTDSGSALLKIRIFSEHLVQWLYVLHNLPLPYQPNLFDLLTTDAFKAIVPKVVLDKLHLIRIKCNRAVHGQEANTETALLLLKETYDLGRWLFITYGSGRMEDCPVYKEPPIEDTKAQIKRDKKAALERLSAQESKMQELLRELEVARAEAQQVKRSAAELHAFVSAGESAVDELRFDELTTRKLLIDGMLAAAGWDVANPDDVTLEEEVPNQPTETGRGYADYVLWDDNAKPLAVVEAKKTAVDAELGRTQAKLYADGLENKYGQRPVIFYTNGFDTFIWDDAQGYPPRNLYGFYAKDSLQYLLNFQRKAKLPLDSIEPQKEITDRLYQILALKKICEQFSAKRRKALVVQATGTGKTRLAVSLTDMLMRASWVKRVLFLCDRLELRKQAKNAFTEFINEPITTVRARTEADRDKRIYLGTYPAMMKIFQKYEVGFFDLIIADESHRSIYNRYRDLFKYFDCLQVGLTATPVDKINRNTFRLFDCEERLPTVHYSLEEAIEERFLVPYEVFTHTTAFLRGGIKYEQLTEEQRHELEDDEEHPELFNYDPTEIDKKIYNKDTNRLILRNLMENGIRDASDQLPGKSVIFARNHQHAVLLSELFDELYPQYGGNVCRVIDTYDTRAEQLIDNFKDPTNELTIAISVDMLDTGIDVPEIVNLVFAKPVFSWVKFWQMIGRGTRLCRNLFGLGNHKEKFRIFDHWGNFERFEVAQPEAEQPRTKPLMQQVFEARIDLAHTALNKAELDIFKGAIELLRQDLNALPEKSIAVLEKWKEKRSLSRPETLGQFAPATVAALRSEMAPLMQWVYIRDHAEAYRFDLLVAQAETELLRQSARFNDLKDKISNRVTELLMHLNPVRAKAELIKRVLDGSFWSAISVANLENFRKELRGIMHHRVKLVPPDIQAKIVDVSDGAVEVSQRSANIQSIDRMVYTQMVEQTLREMFDANPILRKIKRGESVSEADLVALTSLVLTQNPSIDLSILKEFYPETAGPLDFIIRTIVGMEPEIVQERFGEFARKHPGLTARQTQFLSFLQNHINRYGTITVERLYEPPFTTLASNGLDGVFEDENQIDELIALIRSFQPHQEAMVQ